MILKKSNHFNTNPGGPTIPLSNRFFSVLAQRYKITSLGAVATLIGLLCPPAHSAELPIEDYLEMDFSQLMEVTVTSVSKRKQALGDVAAAVYVISQEDIRRSGVTSIPDVLALAPGIHVAKINSSKWSVSARGFSGYSSNKLLVLLDGRSIYSPAFSGTFWDMPHTLLEDIDRIEIIRGPGGTIWGSNAVNGVINIITKSAEDTQGTMLRAGLGSEDKFTAAARVGGKLADAVYGRLFVNGMNRDSTQFASSGQDAGDEWNTLQAGFKVDGTLNQGTEWTIQGDVSKNEGDQVIFPYWVAGVNYPNRMMGDFTPLSQATDLDNKSANIIAKLEHTQDNDQTLSLQMYYDYRDRNEDPYNFTFNTLDFDLQYQIPVGHTHNITLGGGYRYIASSFDDTYMVSIPDNENDLLSAFIQDEVHLFSDQVIATIGMKWEHNDFTGSEWQPSARLLWKPQENHSLWTSISRAVRIPSLIEDSGRLLISVTPFDPYGNPIEVPFYSLGNPEFQSETVYAYEAGHRWQPNKNLSTDIAIFYNQYQDLYSLENDGTNSDLLFVNLVNADTYGIEASVKWKPLLWLGFDATYTYQHFDFEDSPLAATDVVFAESSPSHILGIRSTIDITKTWQFNCWLRWQDETTTKSSSSLYQSEIDLDAFFTLDINVIWKPKNGVEVMLSGQNLLQDGQLQYVAEAFSQPSEIERSVYLKVTWTF